MQLEGHEDRSVAFEINVWSTSDLSVANAGSSNILQNYKTTNTCVYTIVQIFIESFLLNQQRNLFFLL